MTLKLRNTILGSLIVAGQGFIVCGLFCIGANVAQAAEERSNSTSELSEIVVTAERREERSVDVPISVVEESATQLENAVVLNTLDLSKVVPGLLMTRVGTPTAPAIRGVSTKVTSPGADPNVATYLDGFYQSNFVGLDRTLLDVDSIEVLKGPQGTLFGRNSTGGAILINTKKPSYTPEFTASASWEGDNGHSYVAYGSAGLSQTVAVSISAVYADSDGWIRNIAPGYVFPTAPTESEDFRGKLLFEPTSKLSFVLSYEHGLLQDSTGVAFSFYAHPLVAGLFPVLTPRGTTALNQRDIVRNYEDAGYLTATWDLDWAVVKSLTQVSEYFSTWNYNISGAPLPLLHVLLHYPQHTQTQEINLTSKGDGPLQWIAGAFYFHDTAEYQIYTFDSHYGSRTTSWAVYADATLRVIDRLFLTGGVRFSSEQKHCLNSLNPAGGGGALVPCTTGGSPILNQDVTTPRAVARYELSTDTSVYASFSQGYKSGGFNDAFATPYAPERITDWELGFKTSQGRYRLELSAFHYDYKNLQFEYACAVAAPPTCLRAGGTVTTNAASATSYGGEAQLTWAATDLLQLNAGMAYLHARYDKFLNAAAAAPENATSTPACLNPNPILCPNMAVPQDWSGQSLIRAPAWSASAGFTQNVPTRVGTFQLAGNVSYVDGYQSDTDSVDCTTTNCGRGLRPLYSVPSQTLVDMTLSWKSLDKHFELAVYARNLFDRSNIISTDASTIGSYVLGGEPRVVGGRVRYTY